MPGSDIFSFVLVSQARREILSQLSDGQTNSESLVEASSVSQSAAYDAINALEEAGLIASGDECWSLTGLGWMASDMLDQCGRLATVVETNQCYWEQHDLSALPKRFRRQLGAVNDCIIIDSPDTDPYQAARRIKHAVDSATEEVLILAPVYDDRRAEALIRSNAPDRRVVMIPELVERLLRDDPHQPDGPADFPVRVAPVGASLIVTESELALSLPIHGEDRFDDTTIIYASSDSAVDWGRRLFEEYWDSATPVESYVENRWPELLPKVNR